MKSDKFAESQSAKSRQSTTQSGSRWEQKHFGLYSHWVKSNAKETLKGHNINMARHFLGVRKMPMQGHKMR